MKIPNLSEWLYTGDGPGKNMPHRVIARDAKNKTITTWSIFEDTSISDPGFSWHGSVDEFLKNFQPTEHVS